MSVELYSIHFNIQIENKVKETLKSVTYSTIGSILHIYHFLMKKLFINDGKKGSQTSCHHHIVRKSLTLYV